MKARLPPPKQDSLTDFWERDVSNSPIVCKTPPHEKQKDYEDTDFLFFSFKRNNKIFCGESV